jgi:hypothetical protein
MPEAVAHNKFSCPACGAEATWNPVKKAHVCAHCGSTMAGESDSESSGQSALQPSLPAGFAQSPLGKLAIRFSDPQQDPGSFVRGLRDLSADAEKSGVFSTLGAIAKIVWWLAMLVSIGLAVLCVIGAVKGRQAGILWLPAGVFAFIAWCMFSMSSKK